MKIQTPIRAALLGLGLLAAAVAPSAYAADEAPAPIKGVEAEVTGQGAIEVAADCQPFAMTDQDRELSERVMESLRADDKLRGRIGVSVLGGQVILTGTVDSVPMIYRAVEVSRRVTGNSRVNADRLERG